MKNTMKCPKCGQDANLSGRVSCWCNKDHCMGQRCGSDELFATYQCSNDTCGATGTPPDTEAYRQRHLED